MRYADEDTGHKKASNNTKKWKKMSVGNEKLRRYIWYWSLLLCLLLTTPPEFPSNVWALRKQNVLSLSHCQEECEERNNIRIGKMAFLVIYNCVWRCEPDSIPTSIEGGNATREIRGLHEQNTCNSYSESKRKASSLHFWGTVTLVEPRVGYERMEKEFCRMHECLTILEATPPGVLESDSLI